MLIVAARLRPHRRAYLRGGRNRLYDGRAGRPQQEAGRASRVIINELSADIKYIIVSL